MALSSEFIHKSIKSSQSLDSTRGKRLLRFVGNSIVTDLSQSLQKGRIMSFCPGLQRANGLLSNASTRHIYDSKQIDVVLRIMDHSEVGNNVFALLPVIKARAANQFIRDTISQESLLL